MPVNNSIFNYFEERYGFKPQHLNFRFPIETLNSFLKKFYKEHELKAFLVQASRDNPNLMLKKLSDSYLLQIPLVPNTNEKLFIGLSDLLCFLILFDELEPNAKTARMPVSRFYLTFDQAVIKAIFDYFYKNYCQTLSLKERKLLLKLKNVKESKLSPYFMSRFQESLLVSALSENNKVKEQKIIDVMSFADEAIAICDLACNITEANENCKSYFNIQPKINNIKEILPEAVIEKAIKETYKKNKWQSELELRIKNKTELLQVSCYLYKDELKRPSGFVFSFKDLAELKKLDNLNKKLISKLRERNVQLSEVNRRLLEADAIKTDLLSVVSHELKTPVSSIVGFSELIANRDYDTKTVKSFAEQINNSANILDRLITDYLDVAANHFGVSSNMLYTSPVNMIDLIKVVYEEESSKFQDMKFQFELNSLGFEPIIITEADNMKKLFGNLINNSLKYSPNGGKISVKILNDSENITVSLADQGIGITPDQAKRVFEPFYRLDNSLTREFPGIGLGLAVCKKIVEIYNGSIWCEPGVDLGTVFYVTLPVNPHKVVETKQKVREEVNANERETV